MSWLTDLAGRAEELLNKVDQSAAVVLKKDEDGGPSQLTTTDNHGLSASTTTRPSVRGVDVASPPLTSSSSTVVARPFSNPLAKFKSKKQIEEERLLEFLNSSAEGGGGETRRPKDDDAARTVTDDTDRNVSDKAVLGGRQSEDKMQTGDPSVNSETSNVVSDMRPATTDSFEPVSEPSIPDQSTSKMGSLELENKLLNREIASLNSELKQSLQKTHNADTELRFHRSRLEACSAEMANEAKAYRECRERESDLRSALEAKDSQLAVLRVRLDEADRELAVKRQTLEKLEADNRRILEDHSTSSGLHGQTIQAAQDRLQQAEEFLERERVNFRTLQAESSQRTSRLEEEVSTLASSFSEAKSNLEDERSRSADLTSQLRTVRLSLESVQQELTDYKTKAQRILQSKERLIASLKESAVAGSDGIQAVDGENATAAAIHLEELRQERDLLKEEVVESGRLTEQLRGEMQDASSRFQSELDASRECGRELEERLKEERRRREECEQEAIQLKDEVRYFHEDGSRQRATLQSRLVDRDAEIERLRKQLVVRQVNTGGGAGVGGDGHGELEMKLSALTENLIQKQTLLETLSTERNSLVLQLERAEQQLKEQTLHSRRNASTAVNVNDDGDVKLRVAGFMAETPFDGQVARKVKRVYNTIDTFSFRLGVFLRRYPMARVLVILYMLLLHFWVMVVLLTYSPEIHDKDCAVPNGKR